MKPLIQLNGEVRVTDPCYSVHDFFNATLKGVLPGTWTCYARKENFERWGIRITSLTIRHCDYPKGRIQEDIATIGVDSGQCGFFDPEYYDKHQEDDDWENPESWYRKVSDLTSHKPNWGVVDGRGVVSASGFGDGAYIVYGRRNKDGLLVGLKIVFT